MKYLTLNAPWNAFFDQKPTFYWVLHEYQKEICEPPNKRAWKAASTLAHYSRLYNELILPRVNHCALADFSLLEFEDIVIDICDSRVTKGGEYPEETVNDIWRAIQRVCQVAAKHDICDDVCWDSPAAKDEPIYEAQAKEQLKIPKHLTPEQEHTIAGALLSDPLQDGTRNGLMLMYVFGLRNNEACGITFGSIVTIAGQPYLASHKSTDKNTHTYRGKGKTYNMYRLLWIPPRVYAFLMKVKEHVMDQIQRGEIVLPQNSAIRSIDDLPIVRNKGNWLEPCISSQLTSAGRRLFAEVNYSVDAYSTALRAVLNMDDAVKLLYGDTKDPTAYIFRRNFASHLCDCGASTEQLQYAMGHQIIDDAFARVDFTNPDMLRKLADILSRRPIINEVSPTTTIAVQNGIIVNDVSLAQMSIPLSGKHYRLHIMSYEPHEPLRVDISPPEDEHQILVQYHHQPRLVAQVERDAVIRNANVRHDYYQLYLRKKQ